VMLQRYRPRKEEKRYRGSKASKSRRSWSLEPSLRALLYRGKHCKQGPYCWPDERGDHRKLLAGQLEEIVSHIKGNMTKGVTEEDVNVDIEIPSHVLKNILDNSRKRKVDSFTDC
jgi:hypothetical protein